MAKETAAQIKQAYITLDKKQKDIKVNLKIVDNNLAKMTSRMEDIQRVLDENRDVLSADEIIKMETRIRELVSIVEGIKAFHKTTLKEVEKINTQKQNLAKKGDLIEDEIQNSFEIYDWPKKITRRVKLDDVPNEDLIKMGIEIGDDGKPVEGFIPERIEVYDANKKLVRIDMKDMFITLDLRGKSYDAYQHLHVYAYGKNNIIIRRLVNLEEAFNNKSTSSVELLIIQFVYLYGDGERELPIFINGFENDEEEGGVGGSKNYWAGGIKDAASKHTGYTEDEMVFIDGDDDGDGVSAYDFGVFDDVFENISAEERERQGREKARNDIEKLIGMLRKNKEGKVVQRIMLTTHSRGSAFGNGYARELQDLALGKHKDKFQNPENIFDSEIHLDPHAFTGETIDVGDQEHDVIAISHDDSGLGEADLEGTVTNIETDLGTSLKEAHGNGSFVDEYEKILHEKAASEIEDRPMDIISKIDKKEKASTNQLYLVDNSQKNCSYGDKINFELYLKLPNKTGSLLDYEGKLVSNVFFDGFPVDDIDSKKIKISHRGGSLTIPFYQTIGGNKGSQKALKFLYRKHGKEGIEKGVFKVESWYKIDDTFENLKTISLKFKFPKDFDYSTLEMSEAEKDEQDSTIINDEIISSLNKKKVLLKTNKKVYNFDEDLKLSLITEKIWEPIKVTYDLYCNDQLIDSTIDNYISTADSKTNKNISINSVWGPSLKTLLRSKGKEYMDKATFKLQSKLHMNEGIGSFSKIVPLKDVMFNIVFPIEINSQ